MRRTEITGAVQRDSELELESGVFETPKFVINEISLHGVQPDAALKKGSRFGASSFTYGTLIETANPLVLKCRPSGHLEAFWGALGLSMSPTPTHYFSNPI